MRVRVGDLVILTFRLSAILLCFLVLWSSASASAIMVRERAGAGLTDLDFNNDGYINQHDLDILKSHFNEETRINKAFRRAKKHKECDSRCEVEG